MLYKNLSGMERVWVIGSRFLLDAISGWKNVLSGKSSFFIAVAKAHFGFFSWVLFSQSKSIFPQKTGGKITGKFDGNIIWQHFIKRKKRFSEIILDKK
jgi:hypothetical protein